MEHSGKSGDQIYIEIDTYASGILASLSP